MSVKFVTKLQLLFYGSVSYLEFFLCLNSTKIDVRSNTNWFNVFQSSMTVDQTFSKRAPHWKLFYFLWTLDPCFYLGTRLCSSVFQWVPQYYEKSSPVQNTVLTCLCSSYLSRVALHSQLEKLFFVLRLISGSVIISPRQKTLSCFPVPWFPCFTTNEKYTPCFIGFSAFCPMLELLRYLRFKIQTFPLIE